MLYVYGVESCDPCEITKLFLRSRRVPFEFFDVAQAPEKLLELSRKLGSPTSGVIIEDGEHNAVMQNVPVAKLNYYLTDYRARHPATPL